jgi:hypothetical protein
MGWGEKQDEREGQQRNKEQFVVKFNGGLFIVFLLQIPIGLRYVLRTAID